jgi:long-chain fatty acid transport protein
VGRAARALALPLLLAPVMATPARASGFLLPAPSAEALGRAGAVAADTDEPAAVWLNPAALAFSATRAGAALGLAVVDLHSRFSPEAGGPAVHSRPDRAGLPALFGQLRLAPRWTAGLGVHVPYGFATRWPETWAGEQQAIETRFHAAAATAVLAWRASDRLAIAGGVGLLRGQLRARAALSMEAGGQADIRVHGPGIGIHAALSFRLVPERLHLGAVYHSRARLRMAGDADFSPANPTFSEIFADQPARLRLTVPDVLTVAVLFRPRPGLSLTAELSRASFGVLDQFHLDFDRPGTADLIVARGRRNPLGARLGAQRWLGRWPLALRGGLAFDDTATADAYQSPFAPDGRRLGLALGAGYLLGRYKLDVAYLYTHFLLADARSAQTGPMAPPRGSYRSRLHTLALTLAVR